MLNFQKNVFDTFNDLKSAMGTDPDPLWMLIYDTHTYSYSAINYKFVDDIVEYSMKNNMFGICLVDPEQLMKCINHTKPHLICEALHEWCTLHRPDPDKIFLVDFMPHNSALSSVSEIEVEPTTCPVLDQPSLLDQPESVMAPADHISNQAIDSDNDLAPEAEKKPNNNPDFFQHAIQCQPVNNSLPADISIPKILRELHFCPTCNNHRTFDIKIDSVDLHKECMTCHMILSSKVV